MDKPVVVVTHRVPDGWAPEGESFVFVTDGVKRARSLAGGKEVGVNAGTIARQVLEAGLLDEVQVDLVPVLLGAGIPFFSGLGIAPVEFDGPFRVVEGVGVTHLAYRVRLPA